jgi:Replication-relaxation
MIENRSSGRDRVVRTRRSPFPSATGALAEIDQRLLDVLCTHRVVRQDQLGRLFPEIPERTLRYRTRRLHDLGLAGRSRPYREQGSAPNHHWPTRHADCLMRGEPIPRGGERKQPNPVFLAHATALTELYVAVVMNARETGFKGLRYERESEARETFKDGARERALAPDATLGLLDKQDRNLWAFIEIDLGTMSHTRLRAKAALYAAYITNEAWRKRHAYPPALLFLTTTDTRARRFLSALARALSYGPPLHKRRAFIAAAAGIAWTPHQLMTDPCLTDLDGNTGLTFLNILHAAHAPHERALVRERKEREAEETERRALLDDPERMRDCLRDHKHRLASYFNALGDPGARAIELLLTSNTTPLPQESEVSRAIAHDLADALPELLPSLDTPLGTTVIEEVALLVRDYTDLQAQQIRALAADHGEGPSLQRAWNQLRKGELLNSRDLDQLPQNAERDAAGRRKQHERQAAYLEWREQAARALARKAGPLGRLTHRPEGFYPQLDREHLKVCRRCEEIVYPAAREDQHARLGQRHSPCHYCGDSYQLRDYTEQPTSHHESERRSAQP